MSFPILQAWAQVLDLPCPSCVTLGQLCNLSVKELPWLQNEEIFSSLGLCKDEPPPPSWRSALGAEWGQLARSCELFTFTFYLTSTFGGAGPISICEQRPELIFFEPSGHNWQHLLLPYPAFLPTLFVYFYPVRRGTPTAPTRGKSRPWSGLSRVMNKVKC